MGCSELSEAPTTLEYNNNNNNNNNNSSYVSRAYELGIYISLQYHVYEIWPQKIVQKAKPVQSKVLSQPAAEWNRGILVSKQDNCHNR